MALATQKANFPLTGTAPLAWVFITGNGKKDLNGNDRFVASLEFHKDSPQLKAIEATIAQFWADNKPAGAKQPKSTGVKVVKDKDGNDTDKVSVNFWTGTQNKDGTVKRIRTYNAKGVEVSLGQKKIGNGSEGIISASMGIFDQSPANRGVTLYLNAIQLTRFTAYEDGASFDAVEDGWTGDDLEENPFTTPETADTPKPAL